VLPVIHLSCPRIEGLAKSVIFLLARVPVGLDWGDRGAGSRVGASGTVFFVARVSGVRESRFPLPLVPPHRIPHVGWGSETRDTPFHPHQRCSLDYASPFGKTPDALFHLTMGGRNLIKVATRGSLQRADVEIEGLTNDPAPKASFSRWKYVFLRHSDRDCPRQSTRKEDSKYPVPPTLQPTKTRAAISDERGHSRPGRAAC